MKHLTNLLFFFCSFFASAQKIKPVTVQYSTASAHAKELSLDIYPVAAGEKLPVVLFVHGGAWMLGDKATKIEEKVNLFQTLRYVFVSVNYRLSSFFSKDLQFPSHPNDVADAVIWVYNNIENYGGDKNNMVLFGHSAGAQIVSLLGTSKAFLSSRDVPFSAIKGIISNDTEGYDVVGMGASGVKIYRKIFGDVPENWIAASPLAHIKNGEKYPPFLIITRGEMYRQEQSQKFAAALRDAGGQATVLSGEPYNHFEANNKIGAAEEKILTPKIIHFLHEVFKKK